MKTFKQYLDEVSVERVKAYLSKNKKSFNAARDDYDDPKKKEQAMKTMGKRNMGFDDAQKRLKKEKK